MHHIDRDNVNMHYVWEHIAVTKHADAKEGWAKNAICNFVTKASVDEAIPEQQQTLGCPVLGQLKPGIQ